MKLYYAPGACSLSPHIALAESGLPFTLAQVDLGAKQVKGGGDFNAVNSKSYVPVLELDDGQRLTEGVAIVQYVADHAKTELAPKNGTFERYRLQEWLNYIATEVHKNLSQLFNKSFPEDVKNVYREKAATRLGWTARQLENKQFLMGDQFTVADAYLFTVLRWAPGLGLDMDRWPALKAYSQRVGARPKVMEAMRAEGLNVN